MASTTGQQVYYARPIKVIDSTTNHRMTSGQHSLLKESQENVRKVGNISVGKQDKKVTSSGAPVLPPRIKLSMPSVKLQREKFTVGTENVMSRRTRETSPKIGNSKVASAVSSLNSKSSSRTTSDKRGGVTPPPKLPPRTRGMKKNVTSDIDAKSSVSKNGVNASTTPEPQPLTRTNVTKHDVIWIKDDQESEKYTDELCPPLKHITPETTAELWEKYNPIDNLDSASDHSDSSADTMIMMTTDEEKRNEEKIKHSDKEYEANKGQRSNKLDSESFSMDDQKNHRQLSIKIPEKQQKHLEDENFTDDGYGTNSSTSTTLSSSLSSLVTSDLENSTNLGSVKKSVNFSNHNTIIPHTGPQPGTRGTWAVKRRAKIAERHEAGNSLQEKLRQLAIIEEEENTSIIDNHEGRRLSGNYSKGFSASRKCDKKDSDNNQQSIAPDKIPETTERDLRRFEGDLFDKLMDMDRNYRNYSGFEDEYSPVKDDSKVLYFQEKVLKQKYSGSDNYYNPQSYYEGDSSSDHRIPDQRVPDHSAYTQQQTYSEASKSMTSLPEYSNSGTQWQQINGPNMNQVLSHTGNPVPSYTGNPVPNYTGQTYSYRSMSSGHGSMDESCDVGNVSCDNIFYNGHYSLPGMPQKDRFVSVDNINQNGRRPLFASSHDIYNMFQSGNNSVAGQLQRPASYRHSFHAMPSTLQLMQDIEHQNQASESVPRPRSSSASVSAATQTKTPSSSSSSWNPFGSLLRRKSKSDQSAEQKSKSEQKQSKQTKSESKNQQISKSSQNKQKDIKQKDSKQKESKSGKNKKVTSDVEISVHLREPGNSKDKMNGVPYMHKTSSGRNLHEGKVTGLPFKTITLMEDNGTKLSTLV